MNHRLQDDLSRELFVFEDEKNPRTSQINRIWPSTVLDQVFDQYSLTRKTLREILEELRLEIINGGIGNIIFPVTSINGKMGDITISASDVGLGRVDNTKDIDKPLSTPQRNTLMDILKGYDFNVNLDKLYEHLLDNTNPHGVSIEQIDKDNILTTFVRKLITSHSVSVSSDTHPDIRNNLAKLWLRVDDIVSGGFEDHIWDVMDALDGHITDVLAHDDKFQKKEDVQNKSFNFSQIVNNNHTLYPSNKAVVDFVNDRLKTFGGSIQDIKEWISNATVVNTQDDLPLADDKSFQHLYFLRVGPHDSRNAIAVCRKNSSNIYFWDISDIGSISKFNSNHFIYGEDGLELNIPAILTTDIDLEEILGGGVESGSFYNTFLRGINILPGTMDGHIRYYINDDSSTMSDDIPIPGLRSLAFREWITEFELRDNSVHTRHILHKAIKSHHIDDNSISMNHLNDIPVSIFKCTKGRILGNLIHDDGIVHEITLTALADILRPLIGGWPDPLIPETSDLIPELTPHLWQPGEEVILRDGTRGMRFIGKISVLKNQQITTSLKHNIAIVPPITSKITRLLSTGGAWCTDTEIKSWSALGGSNITGHTYADVSMDDNGIALTSISIGQRIDAPYDIWIKYIPHNIDPWLDEGWYS